MAVYLQRGAAFSAEVIKFYVKIAATYVPISSGYDKK
jgi:hypothetical protein